VRVELRASLRIYQLGERFGERLGILGTADNEWGGVAAQHWW
jgi:hypothetical protein